MTGLDGLAARPLFLLGMPRSGTTWLSQMFESSPDFLVRLSPNYSHPLKNQIDLSATRDDWINHLSAAAESDDAFMTQNWRRDTGELATFASTTDVVQYLAIKDTRFHDLYQRAMELLPDALTIYVVRHPGGAINSWWQSEEFPPDADIVEEWRSGECRKQAPGEYWGFSDWCRLTERYLDLEEQAPHRFRVFRYEDLVWERERVSADLFAFVGCEVPPSTQAFLGESKSRHDDRSYSVYKDPSVAGRWRSELPLEICSSIGSDLAGTRLARFAQ
ncbi:MAG: sulfotransferase [Acidimicrobiales bacterium]